MNIRGNRVARAISNRFIGRRCRLRDDLEKSVGDGDTKMVTEAFAAQKKR